MDDFAVLWTRKEDFNHLLKTLTKLYKIKVNYKGNKYLGMTIGINRKERHVTLTMPGYVDKLLRRVKPEDIKGAHTPAIYIPPNYKTNVTQRATMDTSKLASASEQKYLQSVIGTLLYYSRAVDPTLCTASHELGSIQSAPTQNDLIKLDRLLAYACIHASQQRHQVLCLHHEVQYDVRRILLMSAACTFGIWTRQLSGCR